jgi:anthranilate phosphoribosyltransferase
MANDTDGRPSRAALLAAAARMSAAARVVERPDERQIVDLAIGAASGQDAALRLGSALLAAACDANVAIVLSEAEEHTAALMGLPCQRGPHAVVKTLLHTGLVLLPAADWITPDLGAQDPLARMFRPLAHPLQCERMVLGRQADLDEGFASIAAEVGLERVVLLRDVLHAVRHADAGGWMLEAGASLPFRWPAARMARGGGAAEAAHVCAVLRGSATDAPLAETLARHAAAALWAAGILPDLRESLSWARTRLSQGVDVAEYGASRL